MVDLQNAVDEDGRGIMDELLNCLDDFEIVMENGDLDGALKILEQVLILYKQLLPHVPEGTLHTAVSVIIDDISSIVEKLSSKTGDSNDIDKFMMKVTIDLTKLFRGGIENMIPKVPSK